MFRPQWSFSIHVSLVPHFLTLITVRPTSCTFTEVQLCSSVFLYLSCRKKCSWAVPTDFTIVPISLLLSKSLCLNFPYCVYMHLLRIFGEDEYLSVWKQPLSIARLFKVLIRTILSSARDKQETLREEKQLIIVLTMSIVFLNRQPAGHIQTARETFLARANFK